jgi:mannose-1-phosphate guanylyltransferase/phosphomannomutase
MPWEEKGSVMRRLLEREDQDNLDVTDGVKVFRPDGWALVIPDPQDPLVRVWAEGSSLEDAGGLAAEFAALVDELRS